MKWHNLRVGLTCLAAALVLASIDCLVNYKFGDWAAGLIIGTGILSTISGLGGIAHIIGWMVSTWEGASL